jgi:hypothetical protein
MTTRGGLGGEVFSVRQGAGFLRLRCTEVDERLLAPVACIAAGIQRVEAYLARHNKYRLAKPYEGD